MEDILDQLVNELSVVPLSTNVLRELTLIIEQQTIESFSTFVCQSLITLEHWAWEQLSHDAHQWINQPNYLTLLYTLGSFNKKLILIYDNIEDDIKASLLIPETINQINGVFEQIDRSNDDNDPFIGIASLWFDNLSFFVHENPQYDISPVICHVNQYIARNYLMTDQFKFYLTQLQQSQSIFNIKQLFYIQTCSFSLSSYLSAKAQNFIFTAEQMLHHIGDHYLQIINSLSHIMAEWNNETLICIACLTSFISACYWWGGENVTDTKILFPTEQICCDHAEALIRIISYKPFHQQIKADRSSSETILMCTILKFLLDILQTQNINWFLRSNIFLPDILLSIAVNAVREEVCLLAYAILGETLMDEKLKELKITDNIGSFFSNILEQGWQHPSKKYKQLPVLYLLRGFLCLSKNDGVQRRIAQTHRISLLIKMSDQYSIIFDIIWALSFNQDIQQQIRSNTAFMSKLSHLAEHCDNEKMRKSTHGILWNLEINRKDRSISEIKYEKTFDIMISYTHKDKVLCKQIYEDLTKAGYHVWIDFDQMHGNVMDAMAQAIEQSHIIIICMSEQYRGSNYCRAEAHYAFQRQRKIVPVLLQKHYKPDGWLMFLIGQLLYVDFTKYDFACAMEMLMKEIKAEDIPETDIAAIQPTITPLILSTPPPKLFLRPLLPRNVSEWTQTQVQGWLVGHNLVQMSRLLADCNGWSLVYLDGFVKNGDTKLVLNLLQEDSLRRTGQPLSLTELSCLRSLMDEQKRLTEPNVATRSSKTNSNSTKKRSIVCCRMM